MHFKQIHGSVGRETKYQFEVALSKQNELNSCLRHGPRTNSL